MQLTISEIPILAIGPTEIPGKLASVTDYQLNSEHIVDSVRDINDDGPRFPC